MPGNTWATGCRGKVPYKSRRMAAAEIRRLRRSAFTGVVSPETLAPYRCREVRSHWHVGHETRPALPRPLRRVRAAAGDVVEITWRMPDGRDVIERHAGPVVD